MSQKQPERLFCFVIVNKDDFPLLEINIPLKAKSSDFPETELSAHQRQLIFYSSLDIIDTLVFKSNNMLYKRFDNFNDIKLSAFVGYGGTRFILMHDNQHEENLRNFFTDIYDYYIKAIMNPLQDLKNNSQLFYPLLKLKIIETARYRLS